MRNRAIRGAKKQPIWRQWQQVLLVVSVGLCVLWTAHLSFAAPDNQQIVLPAAKVHPLPDALVEIAPPSAEADYFDQVKPIDVGYLVWSQFPVKVYIAPPPINQPQVWLAAAIQAVKDWQPYLPLQQVTEPTDANITIQATPPQQRSSGRVRSAETTYQLFVDDQGILSHRFTVMVRPNQTPQYVSAALRHELGHALGIWGHSPVNTDALYFAQVRNPAPISARDVNTLRRVYEQPTRLGWPVPRTS
jgi:predicted Zn-dependent protease